MYITVYVNYLKIFHLEEYIENLFLIYVYYSYFYDAFYSYIYIFQLYNVFMKNEMIIFLKFFTNISKWTMTFFTMHFINFTGQINRDKFFLVTIIFLLSRNLRFRPLSRSRGWHSIISLLTLSFYLPVYWRVV